MGIFTKKGNIQTRSVANIFLTIACIIGIFYFSKELNDSNKIHVSLNELKPNEDLPTIQSGVDQEQNRLSSNKDILFIVVMCKGQKDHMTKTQLSSIRTMLKSAAALTKITINFTICSDYESIFQDIVSPMQLWPLEYQRRLQINFHPVRYSKGREDMRKALVFRPCGTYRLMMPDIMQHVDAIVYVDTDTLFLQPPEDLWKEFEKFNMEQVAAFAKGSVIGGKAFQKRFPFCMSNAVNSGVSLMNFTRLRSAPGGGFSKATAKLWKKYHNKLGLPDQDLVNLYFQKYPKLLHELSCSWNYFHAFCREGDDYCPEAEKYGASLVHGASRMFDKENALQFLSKAWEEYEMGTPIQNLINRIEVDVARLQSSLPSFICTRSNISSTFTKRLA